MLKYGYVASKHWHCGSGVSKLWIWNISWSSMLWIPSTTTSWNVNIRLLPNFATGRIRLSVSTVNRTYELSGITHVTPFRKYGKHSTGPSSYGPWFRTYSKLFSCKCVLTAWSYRAQPNEISTYSSVSRGSLLVFRRYGLLYLRTVEYDHCRSGVSWVYISKHL